MKRKYINRYWAVLLFLPFLFACGSGRPRQPRTGLPFQVHFFNLSADSLHLSRLGIVAAIPDDKIQFIKQNNQYHAKFYFSLEITDVAGKTVVLRDYTHNRRVPDFQATVKAGPENYYLGFLDLKPGTYRLSVKFMDYYSKLEGINHRELKLENYQEKEIRNSHILFTTRSQIEFDSLKSVTFDFTDKMPDSLFAYLQFVTQKPENNVDIQYELQDASGRSLDARKVEFTLPRERSQIFLPVPADKMVGGRNLLVIKYTYLGQLYTTQTSIHVRWGKFKGAEAVTKLNLRQLKIIANGKDIKQIEKAEAAKQDSLLMAYWKQRDPTPETPQNELYDEFRQRLSEANQMFGVARHEGWNTDRGYIYVKYGPPEQVEKDISGQDGFSRYEIWVYQTLRLRFIFYDRLGTGDYRLVSQ